MPNNGRMTGMVVRIQRFCLHDGPGIRTTVFLKGCPLTCLWCSNPETRSSHVELQYDSSLCDKECVECVNKCSQNALTKVGPELAINRGKCMASKACISACYRKALTLVGKEMTVDQVMAEVMKDQPFYSRSGGGVTISGGEPLCQAAFANELAKTCQQHEIPVVLDTCGYASWEHFEEIIGYTSLVYFDLKHLDPTEHKRLTGVDNAVIIANCKELSIGGIPLVLRIPLIPGFNDQDEHLELMVQFVRHLPNYQEVNLLPYHRTGTVKYATLGLDYPCKEVQQPSKERVQHIVDLFTQAGIRAKVVA